MRMLIGTTTVTMLAHQPGVETSNAVVMEVWSSSASGTAARAVLRKELVDAGRPPNTKDGAHKVTNANAISRVGSSTSLEAIGPTRAELFSVLRGFFGPTNYCRKNHAACGCRHAIIEDVSQSTGHQSADLAK